MIANSVTFLRTILAFVAILLFTQHFNIIAVVLITILMLLDALDGFIARQFNAVNATGAILDILADRIIENSFWIFFAAMQVCSYWVPIIMMTRSFVVDATRAMAYAHGKTAFGQDTLQRSNLAKYLTGSNISRSIYNSAKAISFMLLGLLLSMPQQPLLIQTATIIITVTVAVSLLRAVPVLVEGRRFLYRGYTSHP